MLLQLKANLSQSLTSNCNLWRFVPNYIFCTCPSPKITSYIIQPTQPTQWPWGQTALCSYNPLMLLMNRNRLCVSHISSAHFPMLFSATTLIPTVVGWVCGHIVSLSGKRLFAADRAEQVNSLWSLVWSFKLITHCHACPIRTHFLPVLQFNVVNYIS